MAKARFRHGDFKSMDIVKGGGISLREWGNDTRHIRWSDLDGWLFFPVLRLVSGPFIKIHALFTEDLSFFLDGDFSQCFTDAGVLYTPWFGCIMTLETIFTLVYIFGALILCVHLYKKSVKFPELMVNTALFAGIFYLIDGLSVITLPGSTFTDSVPNFLSFIYCAIWGAYFRKSRRMKRIFSRPLYGTENNWGNIFIKILKYFVFVFAGIFLLSLFQAIFVMEDPEKERRRKQERDAAYLQVIRSIAENRERQNEKVSILQNGWTKITVKGLCTFHIPPTLELRTDNMRRLINHYKEKVLDYNFDKDVLVVQQSGFNDVRTHPAGKRRYARIILKNIEAKKDGFLHFSQRYDVHLTAGELKRLDKENYDVAIRSFKAAGKMGVKEKLIKWYPLEVLRFGGGLATRISYIRQQDHNPPVYVEEFKICNNDRLHVVTLSYRQEERDFWKDDFDTVKKSFRFVER